MFEQHYTALPRAAELAGDLHLLADRLGLGDALSTLNAAGAIFQQEPVDSLPRLRKFLQGYHREILMPLEWPAIYEAYQHASHNRGRELIQLDQKIGREPLAKNFAEASSRVGQRQLDRLRSLRDLRFVQRYIQAVNDGQARGWHTLVYGMILAIYSVPIRQGLVNYTQQTVGGFIECASGPLNLSQQACNELLQEIACYFRNDLNQLLNGKS